MTNNKKFELKPNTVDRIIIGLSIVCFIFQFFALRARCDMEQLAIVKCAVYAAYFAVAIGQLFTIAKGIEISKDGILLFRLFGAGIFNTLGCNDVISILNYIAEEGISVGNAHIIILLRGITALAACVFMYIEVFSLQ